MSGNQNTNTGSEKARAGRPPTPETIAQLQQQIKQLQQQLQQQQQAATETTTNTSPTNQPTFALSPSLIRHCDFIDYSTKDEKKLFDSATEELPSKLKIPVFIPS